MTASLFREVNALGLRLYGHLAGEGNCFFSPLSIATALSMLVPGARGATLRELAQLLDVHDKLDALPESVASLVSALTVRRVTEWELDERTGQSREVEKDVFRLHLANGLFVEQGYSLKAGYRDTLQEHFRAGLYPTEFGDPQAAADQINRWVGDQTKGMIPDLIDPLAIAPLTRLMLLNAVYFFAEWADQFSEAATKSEPFHLSPGAGVKSVPVQMMHGIRTLPYAKDAALGVEAVEVPYRKTSMLVLLPETGELESVERGLADGLVDRIDKQLRHHEIDLGLPKFEMASAYGLKTTLQSLGLQTVFDSEAADFGAITDDPMGLFVSEVIHRARIRVDEYGTEAAAATAMMMVGSALFGEPPKPIPFIVNRPFVFLIRDDQLRAILFAGRVTNPGA
jgi:serpin B